MFWNLPLVAVVALILIALAIIVFKKNLIKVFLGIVILESAVNLFLITLGYQDGGTTEIYTNAPQATMVLPTPQALTLTSIVIGVATSALLLSFAIVIWKKYGSIDIDRIRRLRE